MLNFFKVRYRVAAALILTLLAVMLPLGYLVSEYHQDKVLENVRSKGEGIASLVAFSGGDAILKYQRHRLEELVSSACSADGVLFCAAYDQKGKPYSEFRKSGIEEHKDRIIYVEKSILREGEHLGYVSVGLLLDGYDRFNFALYYLLPVFLGIVFVIVIIFNFFISKVFISPVVSLSRQAEDINKGEFHAFDDEGRNDEVGDLVRSLNNLGRKLLHMHSDLEQQVVSRTEELSTANKKLSVEISERVKTEQHLNSVLEELSFTVKELEKARDEAEKASKFKSQFLAMISHEIRTPMNAILGMGDLLLETELDSEQMGYVEIFRGSGELLLKIINDILDFVQIESGYIELIPVPFEPAKDMQGVCKSVAHSAHARDIEVICDVDSGVPEQVVGDPVRVRQILMNIVANAVKFTSSGQVDVRLSLEESSEDFDRLLYTVRDTGIGIPEGKRGTVFESFVQADGSTNREFGGIGLGLASASRLATLMGGDIWFDSQSGKGSIFYFSIPFKKSNYEPNRSVADFSGMRILLVDDNETVRKVLSRRLDSFGIEAVLASTGSEAINYLEIAAERDELFDLLIVDNGMADMNGLNLLAEAKERGVLTGVVAIMFSAGCTEKERRAVRAEGADFTLIKPVFDADLFRCLSATECGGRNSGAGVGAALDILLVEDNEDHSKILELFIADTGASVSVARDGLEAVHMYAEKDYDLVFMDIDLPHVDGIEASLRIREIEVNESRVMSKIIALAAHMYTDHRESCKKVGCNGFISKPVKWEIIREVVEAVANGNPLPDGIKLTES